MLQSHKNDFSESVKQGPDSGQNFGPALHKFADPKLGPKTVPETGRRSLAGPSRVPLTLRGSDAPFGFLKFY